ncbi:YokU family protein [Alkalihalobacillus deserti]|uniref:YokU family protein n=1 Tax=Alkalihalobacillus deserti TaxID=2879466 RepID=UPI001D1565B0|nr:YokU family protein [Alkalihalobacillus deserti]
MKCEWCEEDGAKVISCTVYWELPDGSRAIEITETPGIYCKSCGMEYQTESTIIQLEDQLMIIDTKNLEKTITYTQLMAQPKLLKHNYFRF